jgi:hypothetical protein
MAKLPGFSRLCFTVSLAVASALAASPAVASEESEAKEMLTWLRGLRYEGPRPAPTGFSPAQPTADFTAPPGGHEHTQAYKSAGGCVVFFLPTTADNFGVSIKTKDLKCDGKPVEGKGEVQILRKAKAGDAANTVVGILRGQFAKGMLTGDGEKGNFTYAPDGKPVEDTYILLGNFENSVLNGKGERRWTGAKTDQPSTVSLEGTFKDGVIRGGVHMGRLNPLPGVEGDYVPLYFSERGNSYIEQAHLNGGKLMTGHMFFYNDPARWKVEFATWNFFAVGSALTRAYRDADALYAVCEKWEFLEGKATCPDGNIGGGYNGKFFGVNRSPFSLPLPFNPKAAPFNVKAGQPVTIGIEMNGRPGVPCNEGLTRCAGKVIASVLGTSLYWYGDGEVRNGSVYLTSARLYERASGEAYSTDYKYETDRVMASCSAFKSPVACARGVVYYKNGAKAAGEWEFDGVAFEQVSERGYMGYEAKRAFKLVLNGDVRMDYPNGSWAEVAMRDGEMRSVDDCGVAEGTSVTCSIEGTTVNFRNRSSGSSRPSAQYATPVEPLRMPQINVPAYRPIVVPQRPVYTLPGMR